jgi:hypothetical protein
MRNPFFLLFEFIRLVFILLAKYGVYWFFGLLALIFVGIPLVLPYPHNMWVDTIAVITGIFTTYSFFEWLKSNDTRAYRYDRNDIQIYFMKSTLVIVVSIWIYMIIGYTITYMVQ